VPVSIHAYNSPEFDTALVQVLASVAGDHGAKLELYVTEFQEDADAGKPKPKPGANAATKDSGQTAGIVAAGTAIELAVAKHADVLVIKSMLAWSYTDVAKGTKDYDLHDDTSLEGLFG
jgi:hypothetical protein